MKIPLQFDPDVIKKYQHLNMLQINQITMMHNEHKGFISTRLTTVETLEDYEKLLKWLASNVPLPDRIATSENKVGIIASVIEFGIENGFGWAESIGQVIPTGDGRFMIKGDIAKAKIFASGAVLAWNENYKGSIRDGSFTFYISGKRKIGGSEVTFERSYSIEDAKKAGLYNPDLKGKDSEFWRDYPERMCMYRALGFVVRDFFGDILRNIVLTEEYTDYKKGLGNTVKLNGHEMDMSEATKQEKENGSVTKKLVDRVKGKTEDAGGHISQEPQLKGVFEGKIWSYAPETDNLSIQDLESLDENSYNLGNPVTGTIEEGRALKLRFEQSPNGTDPFQETKENEGTPPWHELVKQCDNGGEMITFLNAKAPAALLGWVDKIPGRKTTGRLLELTETFAEDENQMEAFFIKKYPEVELKREERNTEKATERPHLPQKSSELPEDKGTPDIAEVSGNRMGIIWGDGSPDKPRHHKLLHKVMRAFAEKDGRLFPTFEDKYNTKFPDSALDVDDAMLEMSNEALDEFLNDSLDDLNL